MYKNHFLGKSEGKKSRKVGGAMSPFFKGKKKAPQTPPVDPMPGSITSNLQKNLDVIKQKFGNSPDIIIRELKTGFAKVDAAVIYVQGMVDSQLLNDFLLESLMKNDFPYDNQPSPEMLDTLSNMVIALGGVTKEKEWSKLLESLLDGSTLIFIDGIEEALAVASTKGGETRSISEPSTQNVIRGSREAFTENISTNLSQVRRIIKSPDLWIESMKIGTQTHTEVSMMYMNNLAESDVVNEVRKRLKKINIDSVLESGYIEQLIEDQPASPFPQVYYTERPDVIAGNLLEGRIAIFVNGTPFVLLVPVVFLQFFQTPDDYYFRFDIATATRFLRIIIFFISLVGPAIYIAAASFHQEMIPTQLMLILASQRETVPFPAILEALIMELTFEILREAGLRMPKAIGSTVSIVGGLVIGQSAVQAGIVSPPMVIVVAITAIASFATPSFSVAISVRLLRFAFMGLAAAFGFFGIIIGLIMLTVHLCSLRSFGVPYMAPFAPYRSAEFGDAVVRAPWWATKKRPALSNPDNMEREGEGQMPAPPQSRVIKNKSTDKGNQNES